MEGNGYQLYVVKRKCGGVGTRIAGGVGLARSVPSQHSRGGVEGMWV
jgi:hypothetical protein